MPLSNSNFTGKRLKQERERRGMTIEELAYRAGVSYRTIDRIEAGESEPRRATVAVIQQALANAEPEEIGA